MLNQIKNIFTNKKAQTFYWQTANSFVLFIVAGLEGINLIDAELQEKLIVSVILSLFINLSKYINVNYLQKAKK
jgi:hypothetical protein